jgi:hypothetical protein
MSRLASLARPALAACAFLALAACADRDAPRLQIAGAPVVQLTAGAA